MFGINVQAGAKESGRLLTMEESSSEAVYGNGKSIVMESDMKAIFLMCEPSRCRASSRAAAVWTAKVES